MKTAQEQIASFPAPFFAFIEIAPLICPAILPYLRKVSHKLPKHLKNAAKFAYSKKKYYFCSRI